MKVRRQQEADVQGPHDQAGERMKGGDCQLVDGEAERDAGQHQKRDAAEPALGAVLGERLLFDIRRGDVGVMTIYLSRPASR
jgi:hypothetical protein